MEQKTAIRRILIVNTTPFGPGGIAKVIASYYEQMDPKKVAIDIVGNNAVMPPEYQTLFQKGNAQTFCFSRKKGVMKYIWNLWKVCAKGKYDVIHVHGNSATMAIELLVAWVCGIKRRIAHCHNSECEHKKAHKLLMPLFSRLYTDALACSTLAGEWIFGKNGFSVLNNAFTVEDYRFSQPVRQTYRQEFGIGEDTLLLGHIGYFNPQKNQRFLVELTKELSETTDVKLMLIGIGALKHQTEQLAEALGISDKVLFLGERNDIAKLVQAMDLFLFPSNWEGFGLVLLEAQLSGLYCIASEHVPQITNLAGAVSYLPINSPHDWVENIRCHRQTHSRSACSEAAIQAAVEKGFSIETEAEKLTKLYT